MERLRKNGRTTILALLRRRIYVHGVSFAGSLDPGWDETRDDDDGRARSGRHVRDLMKAEPAMIPSITAKLLSPSILISQTNTDKMRLRRVDRCE
jgi:hypothetical protein